MGTRSYRSRSHRSDTGSTSSSSRSYASDHSRSTAPTAYSDRPVFKRYETSPVNVSHQDGRLPAHDELDPRVSVETYASTIVSTEDLTPQPEYEVPPERAEVFSSNSIPTIPSEFAELFHAGRRIHIEHDDSTPDGNMNLCLDTEISIAGQRWKMTLFHLRMRDLRDRQFSLRRHCRDSGREVCKSNRKFAPIPQDRKAAKRPPLQRSFSSAISSIVGVRPKENARPRRSSGASDEFPGLCSDSTDLPSQTSRLTTPTNTVRLEFSNYALVEIHATGTKSSKQYDFDYWGSHYYWKRQVRRDGHFKAISYHLINATSNEANSTSNEAIAHITPEPLTRLQAIEEEYKGGWVPPCSLFITDQKAFSTDLADVIVATGLIALVDDCITRRWHSKGSVEVNIPAKSAPDYITPKRLIDEIFNRRSHTTTS